MINFKRFFTIIFIIIFLVGCSKSNNKNKDNKEVGNKQKSLCDLEIVFKGESDFVLSGFYYDSSRKECFGKAKHSKEIESPFKTLADCEKTCLNVKQTIKDEQCDEYLKEFDKQVVLTKLPADDKKFFCGGPNLASIDYTGRKPVWVIAQVVDYYKGEKSIPVFKGINEQEMFMIGYGSVGNYRNFEKGKYYKFDLLDHCRYVTDTLSSSSKLFSDYEAKYFASAQEVNCLD